MASEVRRLGSLEERMTATDLSALDAAELKALSREANTGLRVIEGYITRITAEAARREAAGTGTPAEDFARSGGVSRRRAKRITERAKLASELPKLGSGIDEGSTNTENLDHLARRTTNLSESERKLLAAMDGEVAAAAAYRTPEQFEKYLTKLLAGIKDPVEGASIAQRQHNASTFTMERRFDGKCG